MNFKWLTTPFSNKTRQVEVPRLWYVRWQSRHGDYYVDTRPEMEAFTTEQLAIDFADSLRAAFRLVRHKGADKVSIE